MIRQLTTSAIGSLLILVAATAGAAQKVWLTEQPTLSKDGLYHVRLEKDHSRNADWGTFYAGISHPTNGLMAEFRGVCAPFLSVRVIARDARKLDLARFAQTRAGSDLPIADILESLRRALQSQCESLEVMRVHFSPAHQTKVDYRYTGTAQRSIGWQLEDGIVATQFDGEHTFEFALRDPMSVAGVYYKGGCSEDPILTLQPRYANESERALAEPPEMSSYAFVAQRAAEQYGSQCPSAKQIRFIVDPIPHDYECRKSGDCFLTASKSDSWKASFEQLQPRFVISPIGNFADITEVLAAGEHRILDDYTNFFAFYYESFIGVYSDHCSGLIKDPVGRAIQSIERRFDSTGGLISEREAGPRREIVVERAYADGFDRYFGSWKLWGTMRTLRAIKGYNPNQQLGKAWDATALALGFFTSNYNALENTVSGNCRDDRVQTAYANMLRYANGEPAIAGKFKTNKEPYVALAKNGPSAPAAAARLVALAAAETAERSAEQRTYEAREQQKVDALQQRIREEIKARNASRAPAAETSRRRRSGPATDDSGRDDRAAQLARVQEQVNKLAALNQEFANRLRAAQGQAERQVVQQEFAQRQAQLRHEYQQLMLDMQQSR